MIRLPWIQALGLATAVVVVAGCGAGEAPNRTAVVGEPFPDYVAATLDGDTIALRDLRGQVVLLNVWATWCPPCRREMPGLQALHEELVHDGLRLVGVSIDGAGTEAQVRAFLEEYGITYTILHDPDTRIGRIFNMIGIPHTFLIDREGRLLHQWFGEIDPMGAEVKGRVVEALGVATRTLGR